MLIRILALGAVLWLGLASCGLAQVSGGLRGVVADTSGAPIPGAQVTVSNDTGINKLATTIDSGAYLLNGLTPGKYTVKASFPGMQSQPATVDVGQVVTTLDIILRLILEKQEVTVQADAGPTVKHRSVAERRYRGPERGRPRCPLRRSG
jgi:hypothetical protein